MVVVVAVRSRAQYEVSPARAPADANDAPSTQPWRRVLDRWGVNPIAASIDQPSIEHLTARDAGLLAYRRAGRFAVSLGGALGTETTRRALWTRFVALHPHPMGAYLTREEAEMVRAVDPRSHVVPFGVEYIVSPHAIMRAQSISKEAASAARKAPRKGLSLHEVDSFAPWAAELAAINHRFCTRSEIGEELQFLNRPALAGGVRPRRFLIRHRATLLGFVELDRAPAAPERSLLNIIRFDRCSVWGVYHWVVDHLVRDLAHDPDAELSLGFSPLSPHALSHGVFHASALVRAQVEWLVGSRQRFYSLEAVEQMKALWPHRVEPRYLTFRTPNVIAAGNALCVAHGLAWTRIAMRRLAEQWRG